MQVRLTAFRGIPKNYSKVDTALSRSAQPLQSDFEWLKDDGVTDIINFRCMTVSGLDFDEKETVEALGMRYHNIPTITSKPNEENVNHFLYLINTIRQNGGKAHIHCKAGADRTGMYAFIYKVLNGLGSVPENESEWIEKGHNIIRFPNLRSWAMTYIKKHLQ